MAQRQNEATQVGGELKTVRYIIHLKKQLYYLHQKRRAEEEEIEKKNNSVIIHPKIVKSPHVIQ